MSWVAIARKDFRDAVRSRSLWFLSGIFLLLAVGTSYAYAEVPEILSPGQDPSMSGLVFFLAGNIALFVSLTAIVVCYRAIAGERESGSMKLLLGLPHSRRDAVLGKVVGRTGVLALPVLLGMLVGLGVGGALLGDFAPVAVLVLLLVSLVFVVAYVAVMVGISASTGSTSRASALAVGFFFVVEILWEVVQLAIVWVVNGFALPSEFPEWLYLVNQIPPSSAYTTALVAVLPDIAESAGQGAGTDISAFYGTPWVGVVMLVLWLVVPIAVGYWRFRDADL